MAMLEVGQTLTSLTAIPVDPYKMEWGLQDISADDAGRTEDLLMQKNLLGNKRKLNLAWHQINEEDTRQIIALFNHEYFYVKYYDALDGATVTRLFYHGDISASVKMWTADRHIYGDLAFNIIER